MAIYNEAVSDLVQTAFRDGAVAQKESPGVAVDTTTLTDVGAALADFDELTITDVAVAGRLSSIAALDLLSLSEVATAFGEEDVLTLLDAATAQRVWRQIASDSMTYGDVSQGGDANDTAADDLLIFRDSAGVIGPVVLPAADALVLADVAVALGGWQPVSVASGPTWRLV